MLLAKGEIIEDIEAQIKKMGGQYRDWRVGVGGPENRAWQSTPRKVLNRLAQCR
jgi:hypothetical protein